MEELKSIARNRPRRKIRKPARFDDTIAYAFPLIDGVPNDYKDATQSPDRLHWQEGMNQEIASLEINQTWDLVQLSKEAIWMHGLINDLGILQEHIDVFCDSQSDICLSKNQVHHARTKHIDVRFHFIREIISEGDIRLLKLELLITLLIC